MENVTGGMLASRDVKEDLDSLESCHNWSLMLRQLIVKKMRAKGHPFSATGLSNPRFVAEARGMILNKNGG